MRIQHNIMAMNAYRNYTNNVSAMKKNLERLSSGYKINRAGDDAAGLAISEKMRAQITGLETAQKNAKDGISLVQTAEGALTEVHDMLNRMVELATQSANGTYDNTTDRYQLQKEVNQLLDEMNRIADSSNFNGIKLLDGTLGLNTDAFEIEFGAADALPATAGTPVSLTGLATSGAAAPALHLGSANVSQANPKFSADLTGLSVDVSTGGKVDVTIAGVTKTITATSTGTWDAKTLADKVIAAFATTDLDGAAAAGTTKGVVIGGAAFTVKNTNGKLDFTYAGVTDGNGAYSTDVAFNSTVAGAINDELAKGAVTVVNNTGTATVNGTNNYKHDIFDVEHAKEATVGGRAGIDLTLNSTVVADGVTLKIDDQEFTFKVGAGATGTGNTIAIDTNVFATTGAQIAEAARQLAQTAKNTTNFSIEVKGDTIHIDQLDSSTEVYDSYNKLKGVFSASKGATAATGKGTNITLKGEIKEGNTISVGDNKYVFTKDASKVKASYGKDETRYINLSDGLTGLDTALKADGLTTKTAGSTLTVYSDASASKAPMVLGKGLTLQIGDTSDDFNQLNVAVQDMHTDSLGVDKLDISTEEAAQQAIQKIKDAINTVSDVRGTLGATQNRLDHTINNLSVMTENIQDAESTIRDVDVAEEMMAYTKNNILIQSAQAMLAQANQVPQGVLQLLQ